MVWALVLHHVFSRQADAGALLAEAVTDVLRAARSRLRGARGHKPISPAASSVSGPVPHTVFNAPLTRRRAVAFASIQMTNLQTVNNAFGAASPTFSSPPAHNRFAPGCSATTPCPMARS